MIILDTGYRLPSAMNGREGAELLRKVAAPWIEFQPGYTGKNIKYVFKSLGTGVSVADHHAGLFQTVPLLNLETGLGAGVPKSQTHLFKSKSETPQGALSKVSQGVRRMPGNVATAASGVPSCISASY